MNAALNATTALLLSVGYLFIRSRKIQAHRFVMSLAFLISILFLISYLAYHSIHGATRFPGTGIARPVYFTILISHTVLAIVIVPLAIRTLFLALRRRFEEHRGIARWTLPLWMYVSVTGVVVYWMLYQVNWALGCPMCKEFVGSQGDPALAARLTKGFAHSIYLLMAAPYLLFAGITFTIIRSTRKKNAAR